MNVILAPYMHWAKERRPAEFDLAASNLLGCSIDDLPGARESLSLEGQNENGYVPLVDRIAGHYQVERNRVMTGIGCSGANLLAIAATAAGGVVLMERPYYDPIAGTARLVGARVEYFDRRFEDGYQLDFDLLDRAFTHGVKLLVLTNPHNPSGIVLPDEAIAEAAEIARKHGASLLVDEVYLDIVNLTSDGTRHTPAARLAANAISTSSLTKSYGLNALRCGWAVASPEMTEQLRRVRDVVDGIGPVPVERLSTLAFEHLPALADRARAIVERNLAIVREWMVGMKRLELAGPVRATVVFPRLKDVEDTSAFAERLHREHGVAIVPGKFFDEPRNFRISLAGRADVLKEGLRRLAAALDA